jgi:tol-pal system protein YbgF
VLAGCVTAPRFRELEQAVADLQTSGGDAPAERIAALRQEVEVLREEAAVMRAELGEASRLAQAARSAADVLRRSHGRGQPDPGRPGELPLIPRPPAAEAGAYEAAFRRYGAGDCAAAIGRFRAFLRAYPRSDYADNALFWIAECHQRLGDPELAALTFERVHREFPDGNKVPDALYRQAVALLEIGDRNGQAAAHEAAAREVLQRLLAEHPHGERAEEARRLLRRLGS